MKSHYDTLGVSPDAIPEVIKAAYRAMSQKYHPDINSGDMQANAKMVDINKAFEVLSSPEKKALYDEKLKSGLNNNQQIERRVDTDFDALYEQAVEIVFKNHRASISLVQRHLRITYDLAARLLEKMEDAGLVSAMKSNGSREILDPFLNRTKSSDKKPIDSLDEPLSPPKKIAYLGVAEYIAIILFGLISIAMVSSH